MEIGQLRHRVTIQSATISDNALGEPVQTWADIAEVWARVEPITGTEKYASMHVQSEVNYRVVCRYQSALTGIAPDDRVEFGSRYFDIKYIKNTDERNIQLEIFCKEHS